MLQRLDVHVQNDTTIRFLFEFQFHFEDASVYKLFFGHKSTDLYQAFLFLSGFCVGVVQKVLKAKTKGSMSTLSYNLHFTPVNKNNNLLIQGRYWLPPKPPRVNDFHPKVVNLKAWFWVNPEELQLTSNPLRQSTKSRLDVFPFFHFVEEKNPDHWLNASFVSMT